MTTQEPTSASDGLLAGDLELPQGLDHRLALHQSTWDLDRAEGDYVNHLKATHTEALAEPIIEVPEEFDRNIAVTSVDALINWGRKSAVWPLSFGLACCAFEMMASAMSRFDISRFGMEVFRPSPGRRTSSSSPAP